MKDQISRAFSKCGPWMATATAQAVTNASLNCPHVMVVEILMDIRLPYAITISHLHRLERAGSDEPVDRHIGNAHEASDLAHSQKIRNHVFASQCAHPLKMSIHLSISEPSVTQE